MDNIIEVCEEAYNEQEEKIESLFSFAKDAYSEFCDIWDKEIKYAEDDMRGDSSNGSN